MQYTFTQTGREDSIFYDGTGNEFKNEYDAKTSQLAEGSGESMQHRRSRTRKPRSGCMERSGHSVHTKFVEAAASHGLLLAGPRPFIIGRVRSYETGAQIWLLWQSLSIRSDEDRG